jgi:LmbE family N-acetylglucosaminyl deacetylase
MELVPEPGSQL